MMLRGLRRLIHTGFVSSEGMRPWLGTLVVLVLTAVSEGCDGRKEFSLGNELEPQSMGELLALSEADLERVDIGRMNLICARETGCGAAFEVADLVRELDVWAEKARKYEMRYRKTFERNPSRYDNSYAKYRAVNLALMVNVEMKCRYQKHLMQTGAMDDVLSPRFFRNPDDVFISGLLRKRRGTCSSFPVLLAALGRRLGYPLYLRLTFGHMFCQWDDGVEHFNIETNGDGVDTLDEAYYLEEMRQEARLHPNIDADSDRLMVKLSNAEALSVFLETAGYCLEANGRVAEAIRCYKQAVKYRPRCVNLRRLSERRVNRGH